MKGPREIERDRQHLAATAAAINGRAGVFAKVFLRQDEFYAQRGLDRETNRLTLDRGPATAPAEVQRASYLVAAREKAALREKAPPESAVAWRSLGPAAIPNGQTYGSGPGSTATMAGRVTAIAIDPTDSDHILVGSAAGGIWESSDGGATWTPRTDDQPTLSIGAMAFDPSDASTVYAGTGEGNSGYYHLGQGILVSGDGGTTWRIIAGEVFEDIGFYRLVVDPRDGQRLIAGTTGGAAVSSDGGTSWDLLSVKSTEWDLPLIENTWDVSLAYLGDEPELLLTTPGGLFAARGDEALARIDVPGLSDLDPNSERMAVAHVPSDPGQAFVFTAMQGRPHLWHRTTADGPYVSVELPSIRVPPYLDDALDVSQATYDWHVSIPPGSGDVVYLGAIELVKGEQTGEEWSWSDISSRLDEGDSIHPDQHVMAFDAQDPSVIYAGNDGGIFRSSDAGGSWESLNNGLAISEVEYLTQRPDQPEWILAGLQDNGTIRREGDQEWAQVALGDGGDCGTNLAYPDLCFHSYYHMFTERSSSRGDPDTWENISPRDSDQLLKLFYPPLEVNEDVVARAGEIVYLSTDSGDTWTEVELPQADADSQSVASALAIPTQERVLVGTIAGDVFGIDLEDGEWGAPTGLTKPQDGWISDLLVDTTIRERHWVTFSNPGAVLRSDDAGASWIDVTANLPSIPVNAIVTDPSDPDRVWVACDVGVFESTDAGGSWSVFGTGLPNALAVDLLLYEPDRLLRVGTRSRGVWEVAVT